MFFSPTILESCQDVVNAKRTFFPLFLLFPFLRSCLFPPGGVGQGYWQLEPTAMQRQQPNIMQILTLNCMPTTYFFYQFSNTEKCFSFRVFQNSVPGKVLPNKYIHDS